MMNLLEEYAESTAVGCYYCLTIRATDPHYFVRDARHATTSTAPRCDLHWRYPCASCHRYSHFMATAWCPHERAYFCCECAPASEVVDEKFSGWDYWFNYRSPWTQAWQPALDRLEFEGRHPDLAHARTRPLSVKSEPFQTAPATPSTQMRTGSPVGLNEVRAAWNRNANRWDAGYAEDGDETRRYLTDDPLWLMMGDVGGRDVLDLGCGNGYLSRALSRVGARVTGVDLSDGMLEAAMRHSEADGSVRYIQASATDLATFDSATFDLVVSNYVLQDVPNHTQALREMDRVLRPGGQAVLVISHPCFSCGPREWQPRAADSPRPDEAMAFAVDHYFREEPYLLDAWDGFSPVPYFHRSLTSYWQAFRDAAFVVDEFVEPVLNDRGRSELPPGQVARYDRIPLACVFKLTSGSVS